MTTMFTSRCRFLAAFVLSSASICVIAAFTSKNLPENSQKWSKPVLNAAHGRVTQPCFGAVSRASRLLSTTSSSSSSALCANKKNSQEWSDFDDFVGDSDNDNDSVSFQNVLQNRSQNDLSACQTRQFTLGTELTVVDYAGSLGFDEVTDWEYYTVDEDEEGNRNELTKTVVQPNPLDPSQPRRTKRPSGSVVRIFRGEFEGLLGGMIRSQGLDRRVLIKEYSGELALDLAKNELASIGKLQSRLLLDNKMIDESDNPIKWVQTAAARSANLRSDNMNVVSLLDLLKKESYAGILGEVNLAELEETWDPNEFYRALGVPAPKPGAIWIVYEYVGLSTIAQYCQPALKRRQSLPVQRGLFGNPIPPGNLPPWNERAKYVVKGIMKQSLEALNKLHESSIAHRSIGRSSMIISSVSQDKMEASSVFSVLPQRLVMKLTDLGFSSALSDYNDDLLQRASTFGFSREQLRRDPDAVAAFAVAEDLHALGFVFVGLLLTTLAEIPTMEYNLPATDEDTLQRLMGDIFGKDMAQFREYVEAEDEIWGNVVQLLDENQGWMLLEEMCFARERVAEYYKKNDALSARALLASKMFQ